MSDVDRMIPELLEQALQTLAFVSIDALEPDCPPPAAMLLVSVSFSGPGTNGALEMAAVPELGKLLALNLLVDEQNGPRTISDTQAADALKELANVTCGLVIGRFVSAGIAGPIEMGLPQAQTLDSSLNWPPFTADPSAHLFSAEGNPLAVRLRGAA